MWFIAHCISRLSHLDAITSDCGKFVYYVTMAINMIGIVLGIMMVFRPFMAFVSASFIIGTYLILLGIDNVITAFSKNRVGKLKSVCISMATKTAGSAKSEKPLKTRDSGTLGAAGILLFAFGAVPGRQKMQGCGNGGSWEYGSRE